MIPSSQPGVVQWPLSKTQLATRHNAHDPNPPINLTESTEQVRGSTQSLPRFNVWRPEWVVQNLLVTTLAIVTAATPVFSQDWPNPRGHQHPVELRTWTQTFKLQGQDKQFGALGQPQTYDWPNPQQPRTPITQRTWTHGSERLPLFGRDQFFGEQGQPPETTNWPLPERPRRATDLLSWDYNLLQSTLATIQPAPFFQTDWPVPRGATAAIVLRTWLDPVKLNLIGQDKFFGAAGQPLAYDWQLPIPPRAVIDLRTWTNDIVRTTLAIIQAVPFNQEDWPVPRVHIYPVTLRTFIDPLKLNLLGQDAMLPSVYSWPNPLPRTAAIELRTWLENLLEDTLGANPRPFAQLDWPVPRGATPALVLRTWIDQLRRSLIGQDRFFGPPGMPPFYQTPPNPRAWPHPPQAWVFFPPPPPVTVPLGSPR